MENLRSGLADAAILSAVMKSLQEGVVVLNHLDIVEHANDAASKILGIPAASVLIGKSFSELELQFRMSRHGLATGDSNGKVSNGSADSQHVANDSYSVTTVQSSPHSPPVKVVVLRDTKTSEGSWAELAAVNESLEKSNQELDQFAYIISHDLKAPLRAISNLSQWLEEDLGDSLSDENRDHLVKLRSRVLRMESLINGVLEYSRVGREKVTDEPIDVFKLVTSLVESLSVPPHIQVKVSDNMPVMDAPRVMLAQVFDNLISNAIKHNDKPGGLIRIYGSEKDRSFEFVVEDNGPGIPQEHHEKIFTIFQTLQARDKFESTGIGLTIVKRILTARGGTVRVESTVGEGSRFIFTWPK